MDKFNLPSVGRGRGLSVLKLLQEKSDSEAKSEECGSTTTLAAGDNTGVDSAVSKLSLTSSLGRGQTVGLIGRGQALSPPFQLQGAAGRGQMSFLSKGRGSALLQELGIGKSAEALKPCESLPVVLREKTPEVELKKQKTLTTQPQSIAQPSITSQDITKVDEVVKYHGQSGRRNDIRVNCVRVKCINLAVYQYHVSFEPVVDSRNMRFMLLNQHREVIGNTKAFDGTILYLPMKLELNELRLKSKRVTDEADIVVLIRFTKAIDPASSQLIPFYNTVLKRCMRLLDMCPVGRNYYDPTSPKTIEKLQLILWPGYVTAIKKFEDGLMLNIDVSHKVLRQDTAKHVMVEAYKRSPNQYRDACVKELVGAIVLTRYNNKNYRVDDIAWDMTPSSSFTNSKGDKLTFVEYYKVQYKIEITDLKQPMLVHRPKKQTQRDFKRNEGEDYCICLVPELCYLTGLSDKLRSDFRAMREIRDNTSFDPTRRNACLEEFLKRVNMNTNAKNELLRWGLELDMKTCSTFSRSLPSEKIMVGRNQVFSCGPDADFGREVTRSPVITPIPINNWLLVFVKRDSNKAENFFQKMMECTRKLGIDLSKPRFLQLNDDRTTSYKDAISQSLNPSTQLVVCIFPTSRDDRYNAIKKLCCVDMPVPSQVIISRTLPDDAKMGKFRSVTMKIALQINCKLGGELWTVDIPLKGLMVCGIDVYHDPLKRGKSVAAFIASSNRLMSTWFSKAIIQQPHQELIDSLKQCFVNALKNYYELNHALPERIVIFRDGVGDGQLNIVAEHEVVQLQSCFEMFSKVKGDKYNPMLTVVVVSKRINTKYFSLDSKGLSNPCPGSVLDHTVTRPNWPDYFLVSQHVRQGTVSPTHYIVVSGHEHLKPDHMQRLSYKLTHMYYNWPGTVRVPAPCQYAHKLAYLVGQSLGQHPAPQLCNKLFYL
uniref:piwi-like protein 2 n=1 Tax=Ciona intestinalis TaxID=7719 RepID=UPI000180C442|nr:piwi-like protein 2 [Ciona intestinalis]|eukprot:XP_002130577.2 piwi-like protein 2 [Ciona intestinalis]